MRSSRQHFFTLVSITACISFLSENTAFAAGPGGSKIFRINDQTTNTCIGSSDRITMTLRGLVVDKQSAWLGFVVDKSVSITFTTTVSGATGDDNKSASFAKVVSEPVSSFKPGQIIFAQEQSLLSQFQLTNSSATPPSKFTTIDVDVGIVRTKGKSEAAQLIANAVGATQALSLPANPFTSAFNVASSYVTGIFQPMIQQATADGDATTTDHITMNIDPNNCNGDDEKTGTKLLVTQAAHPDQPGYLDISNPDDYCLKAVLTPAFNVEVADKPENGDCSTADYTDLQNSYIAFYVTALPSQSPAAQKSALLSAQEVSSLVERFGGAADVRVGKLSPSSSRTFLAALGSRASDASIARAYGLSRRSEGLYREALLRCVANGTPLGRCF